jgi:hypothetical protein
MNYRNKHNEIVKDFAIDLSFLRKWGRKKMTTEVVSTGALVYGTVNDPTLMFKVSRYRYLNYIYDIDRDLVASKVLEEL